MSTSPTTPPPPQTVRNALPNVLVRTSDGHLLRTMSAFRVPEQAVCPHQWRVVSVPKAVGGTASSPGSVDFDVSRVLVEPGLFAVMTLCVCTWQQDDIGRIIGLHMVPRDGRATSFLQAAAATRAGSSASGSAGVERHDALTPA